MELNVETGLLPQTLPKELGASIRAQRLKPHQSRNFKLTGLSQLILIGSISQLSWY